MEIPFNQIRKGQRWISRPNSNAFAVMVEVLMPQNTGMIQCKVLQTWQYTLAPLYYVGNQYLFGFNNPGWIYELLQGQDAP